MKVWIPVLTCYVGSSAPTWFSTPLHLWSVLCVPLSVSPLTSLSLHLLNLNKQKNNKTGQRGTNLAPVWVLCVGPYLCLRSPWLWCRASAGSLSAPDISPCRAPAHLVSPQNWWSYTSTKETNVTKHKNISGKTRTYKWVTRQAVKSVQLRFNQKMCAAPHTSTNHERMNCWNKIRAGVEKVQTAKCTANSYTEIGYTRR